MSSPIIYFYGILPVGGETPYGGGEVGCQRTLDFLLKAGYDVKVVRRISVKANTKRWQAVLSYPFRTVRTTLAFFTSLLFGNRKSIVHLSCFYGVTIMSELILMRIAKMFGYKVICELRAGGAQYFYDNGSTRYKKQFAELVGTADYIFTQGKENLSLISQFSDKDVFYYPNCIENSFAPAKLPIKPKDCVNVIFYGRIAESKNILFIIDVVAKLQSKMDNVNLTIIGDGVDSYMAKVKQAAGVLKKGSVNFLPSMQHDMLKDYLVDKHLYMFPTEEKREGHSNALTEVMGYGIIPIASAQGFNRTVVNCDELIVPEFNAEMYADTAYRIFRDGRFEELSTKMYNRVQENYTEKIVWNNFKDEYERIFANI